MEVARRIRMLCLVLAIACSLSIALVFKHSETAGMNRYAITSVNYLAACAVCVSLLGANGVSVPGASC